MGHCGTFSLSGYTKFLEKCPVEALLALLGAFILQIGLGMILSLGASYVEYF